MSQHEPSPTSAGVSLQAHVEKLRSRCEAVSRIQGGSTYLYEEIAIFLEAPPKELSLPPDDEGNEHQVWFLRHEEAVLKATWPDFFGLLVIHRSGEEPRASPIAEFFASTGWKRLTIDGEVAFFDRERNIAISDTHRGNIILMADGLLAPIDLRVQHLSGALLDTVSRLCQSDP